jgi:hypothetical protein
MEVAQKIRKILFYHTYNSECCVIEGLNGWWDSLAWNHVVLEEDEGLDNEILHLESLLGKGVVLLAYLVQSLKTWKVWELLLT